MIKISDAMNTYTPALLLLKAWGFEIKLEDDDFDTRAADWTATKEDIVVVASDPLRLLGLAALATSRGKNWQRHDDEDDQYEAMLAAVYKEEGL